MTGVTKEIAAKREAAAPLTDTELAELRAAEEARAITSARLRRWLEPNLLNDTLNVAIHEAIDALKKDRATIDRLLSDLAREREARREGEHEAAFLCARLREMDIDNLRRMQRDFMGHVQPSLERLELFLASASPKAGGGEKPKGGDDHRPVSDKPKQPDNTTTPASSGVQAPLPPASSSGRAPIPTEHQDASKWVSRDPGAAPLPIPSEAAVEARIAAICAAAFRDFCVHDWNRPTWWSDRDTEAFLRGLSPRLAKAFAIDHPAGEVAQGWKVVPMKANAKMLRAAHDARVHLNVTDFGWQTAWTAMLSSAPQPPKSNPGGK